MTTIQTKLGLSEKEIIKVEMAISQMRDKGYLTMEDFIAQLGNVLPGVSIILANLLRLDIKNTINLIKKGYISSNILDDFFFEYNNSFIMKEITIILLDKANNALGKANYDRWNKLPWHKRIFGFIYCYKRKFIDLDGFEIGGTDGFKKEDFTIKDKDGDELEIGNLEYLGNGSYVIKYKSKKL